MLRVKYIEDFQDGCSFIIVLAAKDDLRVARDFFENVESAYLDDTRITEFNDIEMLSRDMIYLDTQECREISERFGDLYEFAKSGHSYFDTKALGDDIEIIISYNEYDDLF